MAVNSRIEWHGARFTRELNAGMAQRLDKVGQLLVSQTRSNLNVPYPPASLPSEFPHRRSGDLQREIAYKLNRRQLAVTLIASAKHAKFLELGTKKMKPRQFARRTLREMRPMIRMIMLGESSLSGRFKFSK